jgi:D-Tyr-tRNAtyr deacylase
MKMPSSDIQVDVLYNSNFSLQSKVPKGRDADYLSGDIHFSAVTVLYRQLNKNLLIRI